MGPMVREPAACRRELEDLWRAKVEEVRSRYNAATDEYAAVFTELTVHDRRPEEQSMPDLIAVVDDDNSVRNSVKTLLRSAGYRVSTFESAETFLESGAA